MIPYDSNFDWATNIADLASKLESTLRERSKTRKTIEPFPSTDVPACIEGNRIVLETFDQETKLIEHQASAAADGLFWFDPDGLRVPTIALDGATQAWRREAAKRGKLIAPEEYHKSRHSAQNEPPILVRRS